MNYIVLEQEEKENNQNIYLLNKRKSIHIKNILKKTNIGSNFKSLVIGIGQGIIELIDWEGDLARVKFSNDATNEILEDFRHCISLFIPLPRPQTGKKLLHLCGCFGIQNLYFYADNHNKEYLTSPVYNDSWKDYWLSGVEQTGSFQKLNITIAPYTPNWNKIETIDFSEAINYCFHPGSPESLHDFYSRNNSSNYETQFNSEQIRISSPNKLAYTNLFLGSESGYRQNELESIGNIPNIIFLNIGKKILRTEYALSSILFYLENERR
ncbi:MAG: 16S rRNA (uracil(1498)-N(3))-methyltransferase [Leptospira sp.]|nr:16S rRNA (uracil(1498)-N(3))-methyltransferase [Leptospira sp.]